jgi:low affinity Fe/Cu permease
MKKMWKNLNRFFIKLADAVSFGMGTPTNIFFWILAVVIWFWLGSTKADLFINGNFLPAWFTSNAWNFPLNTITTLAELYIGFLVAAAANRSERELRKVIESTRKTVEQVERINANQNEILKILIAYQKKEVKLENKILEDIEDIKVE